MKSSASAGAFFSRIESGWEPMGVFLWIQTQNGLSALMSGMGALKRRAVCSRRAVYTVVFQNYIVSADVLVLFTKRLHKNDAKKFVDDIALGVGFQ